MFLAVMSLSQTRLIMEILMPQCTSHLNTTVSLNNLAMLYQTQGKYEQTEPLYARARAIFGQQLGTEYPHPGRPRELCSSPGSHEAGKISPE